MLHCRGPSEAAKQYPKKKFKKAAQFHGDINITKNNKTYWSTGLSINTFNYYGDIAPATSFASTDISFTRPTVGWVLSRRIAPRFSVKGNYNWGILKASDLEATRNDWDQTEDLYRTVRNLSFRNNIHELSLTLVADLFENHRGAINRPVITPYFETGVTVFYHNPKAQVPRYDYVNTFDTETGQYVDPFNPPAGWEPTELENAGDWVSLRSLQTEGQNAGLSHEYSNWQLAVPFTLGARYRLNNALDLSLQFSYRWLFTDYIDDIGGNYANPDMLKSDLARVMAFRTLEIMVPNSEGLRDQVNTLLPSHSPNVYTAEDGRQYGIWSGNGSIQPGINPNTGEPIENTACRACGAQGNDQYIVTSIQLTYIIGMPNPFGGMNPFRFYGGGGGGGGRRRSSRFR
ncbi:MAG: hypothetical protein HC842_02735 [Cytophagales bacterium]|nr:hypothetical protein [Cytophagales bacterium]